MLCTVFASFDIGGTGWRGATVSPEGELTTEVRSQLHPSREETDQAYQRLRSFVLDVYEDALEEKQEICATGVGMPAPANYQKGILEAWHKVALRPLCGQDLKEIFAPPSGESRPEEFPVFFTNDGDTLGLGAIRAYPNERALLVVGLGTGLASSFTVNDELATEKEGAPQNREIWNMPFRDGILEDYISRKAIRENFAKAGGEKGADVKEIAEKARENDTAGQKAFNLLGEALGEGLAIIAADFRPTRIVISGRIAKAFDQFGEIAHKTFLEKFGENEVKFSPDQSDYLALLGTARYAQNQLSIFRE